MSPNPVLADEDLTDLGVKHFQVLQKKQGFRFSMDAILLAHFINPRSHTNLIDLGTGSAVLPLLLAARDETLHIDGVEIQPELAAMARRSIALNQAGGQIQLIEADLTALPASYQRQYDYVISNPPFFPVGSGKLSPQPQIAQACHELRCTLAQLITHSALLLKPKGRLCLIHRAERLPELLTHCLQHQLAPSRLRLIHPRIAQPARLLLLETIKEGRNALTVEPPLILYGADGQYSPEVQDYYHNEA